MLAKIDKLAWLPILPRLSSCQGCQLCQGCQTANLSRACSPPSSWGLQVPQHVHQGGALFWHHLLDLIKIMIKISSKNIIITILIRTCESDSSPRKTPRVMTSLLLLQGVLGYVGIESLLLLLLSLFLSFRHGCWYHIIVVLVVVVVILVAVD